MQIVLELSSKNANNNNYLLHSSRHTRADRELKLPNSNKPHYQRPTDLHTCMQQLHAVRTMYLPPTLLQNIETHLRL